MIFLQNLSPGQRAYHTQVCRLAQLILVMPATNAASERSFSTMKRVKKNFSKNCGTGTLEPPDDSKHLQR